MATMYAEVFAVFHDDELDSILRSAREGSARVGVVAAIEAELTRRRRVRLARIESGTWTLAEVYSGGHPARWYPRVEG